MGSWRTGRFAFVLLACAVGISSASAQPSSTTVSLPTDFVLPNYDRIPLGQSEALEGGAFVARAEESLASWYNPAGISRNSTFIINASSAVFEWTKVTIDGFTVTPTSTTQNSLPAFFGIVAGSPPLNTKDWRLAIAVSRPTYWSFTVDDSLASSSSTGNERLNDTSISSFTETYLAFAVSYASERHFHYGISLGLDFTSLSQDQTASDQLTTATTAENYLRTFRVNGTAINFIATLGTQWDLTDHIRMGAVVKTPGISLGGNTDLTYESLTSTGSQSTDLYLHDMNAQFRYNKPFEGNFGVAYVFNKRASIEVDVKFHGSTDQYQLYGTSQPVTVTSTTGASAPVVTTEAFPAVNYHARSVANAAIGGHTALGPYLDFHAGFFTINTPVLDQSGPFKSVDLYGATTGLSVKTSHLTGSLGLGYEFGTSDTFTVADLLNGQSVPSTMKVSSLSLLYALTYTF